MTSQTTDLPAAMAELVEDFTAVGEADRLQLLLELSKELPDLPSRYADRTAEMERVHECQSPLFLAVEVERESEGEPAVRLFFDAPPEAPTTRGFAGILHESLDGLSPAQVLAVPDDAPYRFGLAAAVSPLRMRGMVAMLSRIKRHVAADHPGPPR
ncbi:MAG TPA: SufE family protein [Ornithinimicrobium sp.]|uniref:SufE family protein n=1 Tax=Ornithinimicrobium sp. TaxID=1977084 RepID=UPI002B462291|nr:SufE family protein [Ornithinimicrobium sp.]HKJ11758.1 SufE family protein [Ornithinimicrobium sp.]